MHPCLLLIGVFRGGFEARQRMCRVDGRVARGVLDQYRGQLHLRLVIASGQVKPRILVVRIFFKRPKDRGTGAMCEPGR